MKLSVIVPIGILGPNLNKLTKMIQDVIISENQVIIINDLKDRETPIQLEKLFKIYGDKGLVYKSLECGGPGGARNIGLDLAENEWIVFWDCDDIPDIYEFVRMINESTLAEAEVAIGGFQILDEKLGEVVATPGVPCCPKSLASTPGIWRFAFKKSLIGETRFPKLYMGEDQIFLSRLGLKFENIHRYEGVVYTYCLHAGQATSVNRNRSKIYLAFETSASEFLLGQNKSQLTKTLILQQYFSTIKHGDLFRKITSSFLLLKLIRMQLITWGDLRNVLRRKRTMRGKLS